MPKPLNLVGQTFGEWTVLAPAESSRGKSRFVCRCSCGAEKHVSGDALSGGRTKSCGHGKALNLAKQTYGELTVLGPLHVDGVLRWECVCSCGKITIAAAHKLVRGHTKSCGHLRVGVPPTHGGSSDREYGIWTGMRQRCSNPNVVQFNYYGGRGIRVCDRWNESYAAFLSDMGPAPFANAQIDRIDNDGDYGPTNCRWVSPIENVNNRSTTTFITHEGQTKSLTEWAIQLGLPARLLRVRKQRRWSDAEIVTGVRVTKKAVRSNALYLTFGDETLTLKEWSNRTGIPYKKMHQRLSRGASANAILERN